MTALAARRRERAPVGRPPLLLLVERRQGRLPRVRAGRRRRRPARGAALHAARGRRASAAATACRSRCSRRRPRRWACRSITRATTWDDYEAAFVGVLHELRRQGVEAGVFGDIDLKAHREWVERVCDVAGLSCHLPLWQEPRRRLLGELLGGGVRATVVAVDAAEARRLPSSAASSTPSSSPSSKPPAPTPAARRASTTPWSPPRRCSPRPSRSPGGAVEERDGHWVLQVQPCRQSSNVMKGAPPHEHHPYAPRLGHGHHSQRCCWPCRLRARRPRGLRLRQQLGRRRLRRPPRASAGPITVTDDTGTDGDAGPAGRAHREPGAGQHRDRLRHRRRRQDGRRHELRRLPRRGQGLPKIGDFANPSVEKIASFEPDLVLAAGGIQDKLAQQAREASACRCTWSTPRPTTA